MKEPCAQIQHATNDFCIVPRLAASGAHSMDGLITMDGLMKEPCAQLQHATNDFCIAHRFAESGAHSMDTSFSGQHRCGSGSSARNKRLLYSASSCGIWRSQHGRFDHHGRFDERTLCTSSARNKRLLYSASSCGIRRSQHGHFIFKAFSNNTKSNTGVGVDHHHTTNDFCIAPRVAESAAHSLDGLITMDGLMKEPCAQLQHATNDFCVAPRLAELGAHSMDTSFSRHFPIIPSPTGVWEWIISTQQTTFV